MRKVHFSIGFALLLCLLQISWVQPVSQVVTSEKLRTWLLNEIDSTLQQIQLSSVNLKQVSELKLRYNNARKHYKQIEFYVEYCSPRQAKYYINGPLVPKFDEEHYSRLEPCGFQRIEELLFDGEANPDTLLLKKEYQLLITQFSALRSYYKDMQISNGIVLEMCQLQLFRIASLSLNGYDATIQLNSIDEIIYSLNGMETTFQFYKIYAESDARINDIYKSLFKAINQAKKVLNANKDYNSFNRLNFITQQINPLNKLLVDFHLAANLHWNTRKQALDLKQPLLFAKQSFDLRFFSIYFNDTTNLQAQADLGKLLFFDPIISGNKERACASCHQPSLAFTDGLSKSAGFNKSGVAQRNSPTLLNVVFQKAFFYDGRALQLEQQLFDVVHNKTEMGGSLNDVAEKLKESSEYKTLFAKAFRGTMEAKITPYGIIKAIVEYEKTLISFNSKFDKYVQGDKKILTTREINGYNIFAGKALCGSCHFLPLFNGTVPPTFIDSEFEVIGAPIASNNTFLDGDTGRYTVTKMPEHLFSFKTPSLRNIALTAPYMHNGTYTKLEDVVEFYHKGGGVGFGFNLPNQTLPFDSLVLNTKEKEDLVLFMKTLTDTTSTNTKFPERLPLFENDAQLNRRKIGGEY